MLSLLHLWDLKKYDEGSPDPVFNMYLEFYLEFWFFFDDIKR